MNEAQGSMKLERLAEPFESSEVKFKPQMVKNDRALAMAYIDARTVQDRLDDVLGVENWQDAYRLLPDGSVMCRLRIHLNGQWITKTDVGSPSEQPDSGDRLKAAFSDALKRAAVKFGIGRYLYRLPPQWVAYDSSRRQFVEKPRLPAWAIPDARTPSADLVKEFEQSLRASASREAFDRICQEIAAAVAGGRIDTTGRQELRRIASECGQRWSRSAA